MALFLTVLIAAAGCGGGEVERARELLMEADASWDAAAAELEELSQGLTASISGALVGAGGDKAEHFRALSGGLARVIEEFPGIDDKYAEVEKLDGVGAYGEYATAMRNAIEAYQGVMRDEKEFVDEALAEIEAGGDLSSFVDRNIERLASLKDASEEASDLFKKAIDIWYLNDLKFE